MPDSEYSSERRVCGLDVRYIDVNGLSCSKGSLGGLEFDQDFVHECAQGLIEIHCDGQKLFGQVENFRFVCFGFYSMEQSFLVKRRL